MRKIVWLVPALLLAGCRSEQVAFQFRPAAAPLAVSGGVGAVAVAPPAPAATPTPYPAIEAEAMVVAPATPVPPAAPRRPALAARLARVAVMPVMQTQRLARHLGRRHATEGAAESGLGGIALFFIGIALAVVVGLGALVNVIFSVGFFTGVGYAAAGLVVLALLYSLLSGGKK
ncbi:hypothetical protein [Hymenobacter psoromatis]|uniref:hypothetical protein n=1 Tax=Hymenobacter psoromatis TaxID=1484116 RepID=UPI001CBE12E2|nr:hypothetical protein [Hymenobacter psoromatis]